MNLPNERTLTNEQKVAFAELCKYLNTETSGKYFAFYHPGLPNEIGQNGKDLYEQTWEYIYEKDLLTKEKFSAHFFQNQCRDVDLIFANVDLWDGIDRDAYNKNSPDYVRLGNLYEYSFADLKTRERYKGTSQFPVILAMEEPGNAQPLSINDNYDQYVAHFETNSAIYAWSSFFANTMSDVVEVGVAYQAVRAATAFLKATKAAKKGWLRKLLDIFRKHFNTRALDNLINSIDNLSLKNFASSLKTGDNLLIKQSDDVANNLSVRTFHNNDFTELATIENNVLTIRQEGVLDNGAEIVSIQKLADDIEIKGANGEDLSGRIEVVTDDSGRGWFRIKNVTPIEASLERITISNPNIDITSFKAAFGNDLDILTKFEKGELSVEAWKNAPDGLKTNVDYLKKVSDYTVEKFDTYIKDVPTRNPAGSPDAPFRQYQERIAGLKEYELQGNNSKIWADGVNRDAGKVLEAKFVSDPSSSPFIEGSSAPQFIRDKISDDVRGEFQRYADILKDPNSPLTQLEIVTNHADAVKFFEDILKDFNDLPVTIIVKP